MTMMHSIWQAGSILWALHSQADSSDSLPQEMLLVLPHSLVEVDCYEPQIAYRGTLIVVHGMSPKGKEDARILALCSALSRVGFRVLAPEIASIKALKIEASQINELAELFQMIADDTVLTPTGKLGVLAPSFSGAMSLAAASRPEVCDRIEAICAIGAFTQVDTVMSYLLQAQDADPYGRFIALKKIIPLIYPDDALIQGALDAAIDDNLNARTMDDLNSALNTYLKILPEQDRKEILRLFQDAQYRESLFSRSKGILSDELAAIDVMQNIAGLKAKVFLLHGRDDAVIPCEQSERLYHQLKQLRKNVDLVVTPFIDHGDTVFHLRQLRDVARIIQGFSNYFRNLSRVSV
jgi:pimeloyl-ACP methyl ester carboxylesterase